jgi:tetratricopeptide (TPR) repeat protein
LLVWSADGGDTMLDKIFINYRREDSISTAGRLHDRLAQTFGQNNIFMDVDHIPAGVDFVMHLNDKVATCKIFLAVIGPHWLDAKDEAGQRRIHQPEDFVAVEIAAALDRNIRVIPVLVDGATVPRASELPDSLKPLARRQAVELRQLHFGRDADALIKRVREALNDGSDRTYLRRAAVAGVAAAVLLLVGWIGLISTNTLMWPPWAETRVGNDAKTRTDAEARHGLDEATVKAEQEGQARAAAEAAEAKRKADDAERQAKQERQARAAAEAEAAEAKRKADEAELQAKQERQARAAAEQAAQQQLIALKAEQDRKQAQSAAEARYSTLMSQANTDSNTGNYDSAIATFGEAIRLNPNDALAFYSRGLVYGKKGDNDHAIADYNEAIRLDAKNALAFRNRGLAHEKKGNNDQAIADFSEAIRLDPNDAVAFNSRGVVYGMKGDYERAIADFNKGILLDPTRAVAFGNRGLAFVKKGDNNQAIADFDAAIRLNPYDARAFCNRGITKSKIKDKSGDADIAKARQLDAEVCR